MEVPELPEELRVGLSVPVLAYIGALETAVAALQAEVAEVRARLNQDSRNSSRPPSSDPPAAQAKRPKAEPSQRQPGGQPGHLGHHRALVSEDAVDQMITVLPDHCAHCGDPLPVVAGVEDPADERVQVAELPSVRVAVTEYRLAARGCRRCGRVTRAVRPAAAAAGSFGPRLQATSAVLTGRYRLSRREAAQLLADLWGAELALGSVTRLEQATSAALAPIVDEARTAVHAARVANVDETGWREGRQRAWLWTAVTEALTVFRIARSRAGAVARELLGPDWDGIVGSDRFSAYAWLPIDQRQVCWAHLKRDFCKLVDGGGAATPIGTRLLELEGQVFALWHRLGSGEVDRAAFQRAIAPVQAEFRQALQAGTLCRSTKAATLCWALLDLWPALWTFVSVQGVEPTNNAAERALRPAVLWRKGSFGTHSSGGSRFAERLLTVAATCRQQGRNLLDFLTNATQAARLGLSPPSLLPSHP